MPAGVCRECGAGGLIHCRDRGEVTCSSCGLVHDAYMTHDGHRHHYPGFVDVQALCSMPPIVMEFADDMKLAINDLFHRAQSHAHTTTAHTKAAQLAASIWLVCRERNVPRSREEVCQIAGAHLSDFGRALKRLTGGATSSASTNDPAQYVNRLLSRLDIGGALPSGPKCRRKVLSILDALPVDDIPHTPRVTAAAAICVAMESLGWRVERKLLSDCMGVSLGSLRSAACRVRVCVDGGVLTDVTSNSDSQQTTSQKCSVVTDFPA